MTIAIIIAAIVVAGVIANAMPYEGPREICDACEILDGEFHCTCYGALRDAAKKNQGGSRMPRDVDDETEIFVR